MKYTILDKLPFSMLQIPKKLAHAVVILYHDNNGFGGNTDIVAYKELKNYTTKDVFDFILEYSYSTHYIIYEIENETFKERIFAELEHMNNIKPFHGN